MTETTKTRAVNDPSLTAKDGSEAALQQGKRSKTAPAKGGKAADQGGTRSTRKAAAQQIKLTPAVEAALAKAAADLPLSPSEIVDTALRDWFRAWYPDLL